MKHSYVVVTEGRTQRIEEHETPQEAITVATERVQKNQTNYAGARRPHRYAICKVVAWVEPEPPKIPVQIRWVELDDESPDGSPICHDSE